MGREAKNIAVEHSDEELKLHALINAYRAENNLEEIPLSKSLSFVAQQHCKDLSDNSPDLEEGCNTHSWSNNGNWSSCCYTADHKQAKCMWNKPSELTNYSGYGYEIAVGSSNTNFEGFVVSAEFALDSWKDSFHHNNVILNRDIWKNAE
ncbi:MAG: CAP domain-containing protein, partial [bacterium]|nr:CAP domain-containing protein [bacterium]